MAKVTGIGGVFFKSTGDSAALAAWYHKHLGRWKPGAAQFSGGPKIAQRIAASLSGMSPRRAPNGSARAARPS